MVYHEAGNRETTLRAEIVLLRCARPLFGAEWLCTHVSPGSCDPQLPPPPKLTQKRAQMDPKSNSKYTLSPSYPSGQAEHAQPCRNSAGDSFERRLAAVSHGARSRTNGVTPESTKGLQRCFLLLTPRLGTACHGEKREVPGESPRLSHHLAPNLPPLGFSGRKSDRFRCLPACVRLLLPL